MTEVAPDREGLLRSKRAELSGIIISRKRKLREFFAVCDDDGPIPKITFCDPDAPPTSQAEAQFLEVCDILQGRLFDESNLPNRTRPDSAKLKAPFRIINSELIQDDPSLRATKLPRDVSISRKSRATTPRSEGASTAEGQFAIEPKPPEASIMQRSASKSSQTDLSDSRADLDNIAEGTLDNATTQNQPLVADGEVASQILEINRIRKELESRPGSPGVDPRKAIPVTAEDAAQLREPLIDGLGDEHHKAATVHLPPKEAQEQRLRDLAKALEERKIAARRLSINLPEPDGSKVVETLSSPGSTAALSATTPALHDASTDTSPDESSRFEQERVENRVDDAQTPKEMRPTPEDAAQKEQHDKLLQAQIEVSRAEILRSSPAQQEAAAQDEAQSTPRPIPGQAKIVDSQVEDIVTGQEDVDGLTKEASEVAADTVDDGKEVAAQTSRDEDEPMPDAGPSQQDTRKQEVPDSEGESQTPADATEADTTTVKDSFESTTPLESDAAATPTVPEAVEAPVKPPVEPQKSSSAASTPRRPSSVNAPTPPVERMTTRVSSGAMRHKSVSEILGEIPRPNTSNSDRNAVAKASIDSESPSGPSGTSTPQSPGARMRSLVEKAKEKERSKLSTVVFPKQPKPSTSQQALVPSGSKLSKQTLEDYFMPLFLATASTERRGVPPLDHLLGNAHKTITTSNAYVPILESQTTKVLKRIYALQSNNKWSLRQPKRAPEPSRPTSHWDLVLQDSKWMRTDFREERKWKFACARNLAFACAEWVAAGPEDRKLLQIKATPPKAVEPEVDASSQDVPHSTPDLVASGEIDSPMEELDVEPHSNPLDSVAPTAIFALQDDDVIFGLRRSPTTDRLLNELPMYGQPLFVPDTKLPTSGIDPDRFWRKSALPLSKYVEGRMEIKISRPPRKRSRFEYELDGDDDDQVVFGEPGAKRPHLEPESTEVALFNPENKHIRDRIHAGHQFRPPSEFPMPSQSFFECRSPSQWTWAEDDELRNLVREYSYNWSLISSMLSSPSLYSSGAERRTPWECFERWIHLEGLPADMQKTHYFRAYNNRLEAAQRTLMVAAAQVAQIPNANGQVQPRRRSTNSIRVERRRNQKHLSLVDAMRKLAKKRETSIQKQQHAAGLAAMRKANEAPTPKGAVHTPQDFSKLKHEREEQTKERMLLFQQREAQRRASMLAQRNGSNAQPINLTNNGPARLNSTASNTGLPNGQNPNGQNITVPGQNRARPSMSMGQVPMPNNLQIPNPMNGMPQAQMMNRLPGQHQMPLPQPAIDAQLFQQARHLSQQQRQQVMQQQGHNNPADQMHNSPPRMNGMSPPSYMANGMMQPPPMFNPNSTPNSNGSSSTPPPNNLNLPMQHSPGHQNQGSPRMIPPNLQQMPNGSSNANMLHTTSLEAQIRQKYPHYTDEQVKQTMHETLSRKQSFTQSAMNAAAGGGTPRLPQQMHLPSSGGNGGGNNGSGADGNTSQSYNQMLHAQQQRQQLAHAARDSVSSNNGGGGHFRSGSAASNGGGGGMGQK